MQTHINVTVDCKKIGGNCYDLRVPVQQTTEDFIDNLLGTLHIPKTKEIYRLRIPNKAIVLGAHEYLWEHFATDGDILEIF